MAKSLKNKYKIVIGALTLKSVGDGKEKRPDEMTQPMGPENSRMMSKFSEETELKTFSEFNKEQVEYDKFGHETHHPKSAKETLTKRFRQGRAKHTPHPAPVKGAQYKQTPQMERPHYEETEMTDKTLSKFVAEARRGRPPKNVPAEPEHIVMQLRKVVSMRGESPVEFKDGKKTKLTPAIAHKALEMHDNMKRPSDKEQFAHHISHSLEHMKSGLKGNWQAENKPKITLAGPKLKKEETDIEEAKDSYSAYQRRMGVNPEKAAKKEGSWSKQIKKQEKKLAKEEAEQIDELSLSTMLAYTAKSAASAAKAAGATAGKAAIAGAKKTPEMLAKAAKATGKAIGGIAGGGAGPKPMPMPNEDPEEKETEKSAKSTKPEKEQNLADKLYNRRNQADADENSEQEAKPAAQKKNVLQKRTAGLKLAGKAIIKKATSGMKSEDYAPLEKGEVKKHPDDVKSPVDSKSRKQGAEKPKPLKDPAKYMTKEAREFYEGLSEENREKFLTLSYSQISDLLEKYRNQQ